MGALGDRQKSRSRNGAGQMLQKGSSLVSWAAKTRVREMDVQMDVKILFR